MRNWFERVFEWSLWNTRYVVLIAVVASAIAAIGVFWVTTVDLFYAIAHTVGYASPELADEVRRALRDSTVTHVVEVVDGYLLATVMLIFALGLYELFIGDIDPARAHKTSSRILIIESLDDLKSKLAKVILMILIVRLFEYAVKMHPESVLDLVYYGAAIALIGLALYLTHASEGRSGERPKPSAGPSAPRPASSLSPIRLRKSFSNGYT